MRILVITDLHGKQVDSLTGMDSIDLVLILGDITTGGEVKKTAERIEPLLNSYPELYAVPGNWERPESIQWLTEQQINIDGQLKELNKILLFGLGGSLPTPFNTPNETTEDALGGKLERCSPVTGINKPLVICSHNPPYGACDKVMLGKHVGSKTLRGFIDAHSPALVLSGHIHEALGIEVLGSTTVVNPGPAPNHFALVTIGEKIRAELIG